MHKFLTVLASLYVVWCLSLKFGGILVFTGYANPDTLQPLTLPLRALIALGATDGVLVYGTLVVLLAISANYLFRRWLG